MADSAGPSGTHDVLIGGEGYMVVPGSWEAEYELEEASVGALEPGEVGRRSVYRQEAWRRRSWEPADGESVWQAEGFLPVVGGDALRLAPAVATDSSTPGTSSFSAGGVFFHTSAVKKNYLSVDSTLYEVATSGGAYAGLTSVRAALGTIQGMCVHKAKLYLALAGANYDKFDGTTWSSGSVQREALESYAGVLIGSLGGRLFFTLDETTWTEIALPWPGSVRGMLPWRDGLLIGTDRALLHLHGQLKPSSPTTAPLVFDLFEHDVKPLFQVPPDDSNFQGLTAYGEWVYWWMAGWLWRWDGQRLDRQPVSGAYFGLCVASGWLVASLDDGVSGTIVWLHDGEGWWGLRSGSGASDKWSWPSAIAEVLGTTLSTFARGTRVLGRWDLAETRRVYASSGHPTPEVRLPAIDGGEPEMDKVFEEVGLVLGAPDGPTALAGSPATWIVERSTDGSATWTQVSSTVPTSLFQTVVTAISVTARRLWVRVRCTGGGPGNPLLRSVWAAWRQAAPTGVVRRRWGFEVQASDQVTDRRGARDERSGAAIASALLALAGQSVAFIDQAGASFTVRVQLVAQEGARPRRPSDAGVVRLRLVQV